MIKTNKLDINLGDVYERNGKPGARFVVNRVESTTTDSGVQNVVSIRLRYPYGFENVTLDELLDQFTLIHRRGIYIDNLREVIQMKKTQADTFVQIDKALKALKLSKLSDEVSSESSHLDARHLANVLGDVIVFKRARWVAWIINFIDGFGKNYKQTMSNSVLEQERGFGFVFLSSRNPIKLFFNKLLAKYLLWLNRHEKFNNTDFETADSLEEALDSEYSGLDIYKKAAEKLAAKPVYPEGAVIQPEKSTIISGKPIEVPTLNEFAEQHQLMHAYVGEASKSTEPENSSN